MAVTQQRNLFKVLSERLRHYLQVGDLERASKISRTAVESARRQAGKDDAHLPQLLEALRELAAVRISAEDHDGAALVYREAFTLARGSILVSPRLIALLKSELAGVLDVQGRTEEAIPLYQDAVEIFESPSVNEPLLAAQLRNNLGMIFKGRESLEMAEEHYLVALDVFDNAYGKESLEVASIYNNIGALYHAAGHLDRALEMQLTALELREHLEGKDSHDVGQSLSNVAAAYHALGKPRKAEKFAQKAVNVLARHQESDPECYAIAEENLAYLTESSASVAPAQDPKPIKAPLKPEPIAVS